MSCSHTQGAEAGVDRSVLKQYSWITVQWLTVWDPALRMKATYYDILRLCFALIQYWSNIGSDQYCWCPAVQLELQGTGWS